MKILSFLLCPSVDFQSDSEIARYCCDQQYHQDQLRLTLSGGKLYRAFGSELFHKITWADTNPTPLRHTPVMPHVVNTIAREDPKLVLSFGQVANTAVFDAFCALDLNLPHFRCHHPNAVWVNIEALTLFATKVKKWIATSGT